MPSGNFAWSESLAQLVKKLFSSQCQRLTVVSKVHRANVDGPGPVIFKSSATLP